MVLPWGLCHEALSGGEIVTSFLYLQFQLHKISLIYIIVDAAKSYFVHVLFTMCHELQYMFYIYKHIL